MFFVRVRNGRGGVLPTEHQYHDTGETNIEPGQMNPVICDIHPSSSTRLMTERDT